MVKVIEEAVVLSIGLFNELSSSIIVPGKVNGVTFAAFKPHLVSSNLNIVSGKLSNIKAIVYGCWGRSIFKLFFPASSKQVSVSVIKEKNVVSVSVSSKLTDSGQLSWENVREVEVIALVSGKQGLTKQELSLVEQEGNSISVASPEDKLIVVYFHVDWGEREWVPTVKVEISS